MRLQLSQFNHFLKAPPLNLVTLGTMFSHVCPWGYSRSLWSLWEVLACEIKLVSIPLHVFLQLKPHHAWRLSLSLLGSHFYTLMGPHMTPFQPPGPLFLLCSPSNPQPFAMTLKQTTTQGVPEVSEVWKKSPWYLRLPIFVVFLYQWSVFLFAILLKDSHAGFH